MPLLRPVIRAVIPGEEELGVQRRCPRCCEWFPDDGEFFYPRKVKGRTGYSAWCRHCTLESKDAARRARRAS